MNKKKKILFVAMADSIHTARWISNVSDEYEIHLFSSTDGSILCKELKDVTVYTSFYGSKNKNIKVFGIPIFSDFLAMSIVFLINKVFPKYRSLQLRLLIKSLKPDIIHSLETQSASYLVNETKKDLKGHFPKWAITIWGSDIYLFGRLKGHKEKIKDVLKNCDFFWTESKRDLKLAANFGFKGKFLPVIPCVGGFDLKKMKDIRDLGQLPSQRKIIMLKGYQGWAGRALVGLRALERCVDILDGYKIIIYSVYPNSGVDIAAELFAEKYNIPVEILPLRTPHYDILKFHNKARLSISLGISDGISTSSLEAMVMGSFPIQSNTSSTNEWFDDGVGGFLVPPEDPEVIELAIRKAILSDKLVNKAYNLNWKMALGRLDSIIIKNEILDVYKRMIENE